MKVQLLTILLVSVLAATAAAQTKESDPAPRVPDARALNLVQPEHPARARGLRGTVQVRINIDKKGDVTAALAVSGPGIFYEAAEQAARKSKFAPRNPRSLRIAYAFDDHVQEKCSDHDIQIFNPRERHADNVWDLLTTTRGTQSIPLVAKLKIEFLDTGGIGQVDVVTASSPGFEPRLVLLAERIAFVPACTNGQRVTTTRMVDFDEYGFRLRAH